MSKLPLPLPRIQKETEAMVLSGRIKADLGYAKYLEDYEMGPKHPQSHGPMSREDWLFQRELLADPILGKFIASLYTIS